MKAEDTVMDMHNPQIMPDIYYSQQSLLRRQAKISYKAGEVEGYKQGLMMKEPYLAGVEDVVNDIGDALSNASRQHKTEAVRRRLGKWLNRLARDKV